MRPSRPSSSSSTSLGAPVSKTWVSWVAILSAMSCGLSAASRFPCRRSRGRPVSSSNARVDQHVAARPVPDADDQLGRIDGLGVDHHACLGAPERVGVEGSAARPTNVSAVEDHLRAEEVRHEPLAHGDPDLPDLRPAPHVQRAADRGQLVALARGREDVGLQLGRRELPARARARASCPRPRPCRRRRSTRRRGRSRRGAGGGGRPAAGRGPRPRRSRPARSPCPRGTCPGSALRASSGVIASFATARQSATYPPRPNRRLGDSPDGRRDVPPREDRRAEGDLRDGPPVRGRADPPQRGALRPRGRVPRSRSSSR